MIMTSDAEGGKNLLSIENGQFFFTKYMTHDDFSEPPRRADPQNPIFCRISGPGHLPGPGGQSR